jgi:hypothetical protein
VANVVQRSFAGGELAPELYARTDQVKYATGLRTCRNFIVQKHGGVANRTRHALRRRGEGLEQGRAAAAFVFNASRRTSSSSAIITLASIRTAAASQVAGVAAWSNAPRTSSAISS